MFNIVEIHSSDHIFCDDLSLNCIHNGHVFIMIRVTEYVPLCVVVCFFFSSDFSDEPELMPKTPSQKKSSRKKRVSLGSQEETRARRRFVIKLLSYSFQC